MLAHPFNAPQGSSAGPTLPNRKLLISSDHRLLSTDRARKFAKTTVFANRSAAFSCFSFLLGENSPKS
jgi:hypothetical protein